MLLHCVQLSISMHGLTGNSGFETASNIVGSAAFIHMTSRLIVYKNTLHRKYSILFMCT